MRVYGGVRNEVLFTPKSVCEVDFLVRKGVYQFETDFFFFFFSIWFGVSLWLEFCIT